MNRIRSCVAVLTALVVAGGMAGAGDVLAQVAPGPNGLIAYSSWHDAGNFDIYVVDPAVPEAEPVRLTTDGQYNSNPDWSPDGTQITFDGWGQNGGPRIQVMDVDPATDDQVALTDPCTDLGCYGDFQPAWSPDGTRIAFVSSRPNQDGSENWSYEIYVMDAAGEVGPLPDATRLTTDPFDDNIEDSHVTWSPDGTRIAFVSTGRGTDSSSCDLWMMDSQDLDGDGFGDNLTRVTFDEGFNCDAFEDFSPKWSPNSSLIAFTSTRSGFFDIWLVNVDDPTDLRNVTQTPTVYEDQPGWSPDGTQVIFRSSVSGAYEIYSLPVPPAAAGAGSRVAVADVSAAPTPTQLTFDGLNKQQPDWGTSGSSPGPFMLTVNRTGAGTVTAKPAGIRCGNDCSEAYPAGTAVTLKVRPKAGSVFIRWQGACTGKGACTVTMSEARSVTAVFRTQA